MAQAWRRIGSVEVNANVLNRLTRSARDRAEAAGAPLSRRHLDYVAKAVLAGDQVTEPPSAPEIAKRFAALTVQRMVDLRIVDGSDRDVKAAVKNWLGAG